LSLIAKMLTSLMFLEGLGTVKSLSLRHNKQFKSDSARLAFSVWVEFRDYGVQIRCRASVLHTLIGR
ncbi:hypothetical protein CGI79_22890, partial [Vibrio parahaemolyticus]